MQMVIWYLMPKQVFTLPTLLLLVRSTDLNVYSQLIPIQAYTGWAAGHFGDSIQYVDGVGKIQAIPQASTFGCSHNTGIGLEAADEVPYASVCAEDHGAIWLNTDTRSMNGVKIANENATNGVSGEPSTFLLSSCNAIS